MTGQLFSTPSLPDGNSIERRSTKDIQSTKNVKVASTDLIIEPQSIPVELMTDMTIDDIGGTELINIARHNLITGTNIEYKPFSQMSILNAKYDPLKILSLADGTPAQFDAYSIALEQYLPELNNVSINTEKDIVIEFINVEDGDFVEVQIIAQGEVYNDTI